MQGYYYCLAGMEDRDKVNHISTTSPPINNLGNNWIDIINWVLNLPNEKYSRCQKNFSTIYLS